MGYRIEGDGSWRNTKIWRDDKLIEWKKCVVGIWNDGCYAIVNGNEGVLGRIVLLGVYKVVGDGSFNNTKVFMYDEMLRGVQSLSIVIEKDKDPKITVIMVLLPNLIEGESNVQGSQG